MKRILAIGGGGFLMEESPSPVDRLILELTGKPKPRVCYIGTASGDMPDGIEKFYAAFPADRCEPSHLAFFRKPSAGSLPLAGYEAQLAVQDAIFVSGGNTKSALGVWREWGLDRALKRACASGTLLCGMSAGAMCWFEAGLTDSFWGAGYRPPALPGFVAGRLFGALRRESANQGRPSCGSRRRRDAGHDCDRRLFRGPVRGRRTGAGGSLERRAGRVCRHVTWWTGRGNGVPRDKAGSTFLRNLLQLHEA